VRELAAAGAAADARSCLYVTAGEVSVNARAFAAERGTVVLGGVDLVARLGKLPKPPQK